MASPRDATSMEPGPEAPADTPAIEPTAGRRDPVRIAVWLIGLAILGFLAVMTAPAWLFGDSAFQQGRMWGQRLGWLVIALAVGLVARRIYVWQAGRSGRRLSVRSPWVLAVASLVLFGAVLSVGPRPAAAPLGINVPYRLESPSVGEAAQLQDAVRAQGGETAASRTTILAITEGTERVGLLVAFDADLGLGAGEEFLAGFEMGRGRSAPRRVGPSSPGHRSRLSATHRAMPLRGRGRRKDWRYMPRMRPRRWRWSRRSSPPTP